MRKQILIYGIITETCCQDMVKILALAATFKTKNL